MHTKVFVSLVLAAVTLKTPIRALSNLLIEQSRKSSPSEFMIFRTSGAVRVEAINPELNSGRKSKVKNRLLWLPVRKIASPNRENGANGRQLSLLAEKCIILNLN